MEAVGALLIAFFLLFLFSRVGAIALELTGLPTEVARFQSLSAITGVGFTTSVSELIVRHSHRRCIVTILMFIGSLGTLGIGATLVISLLNLNDLKDWFLHFSIIMIGIILICLIDRSHSITKLIYKIFRSLLSRLFDLTDPDYSCLLYSTGDFTFAEYHIDRKHLLCGRKLSSINNNPNDFIVLGVHDSAGNFHSLPSDEFVLKAGFKILVYGELTHVNSSLRKFSEDE